jgi:pilus assembly protein FimV
MCPGSLGPARRSHRVLVAIALAVVTPWSHGMGWGPTPQAVTLGQPLDLRLPVRLDAGEVIAPECVTAGVILADQRLSSALVRARVDGGDTAQATVRVVTMVSIDEPVVEVEVSIGCPTRLSRRLVLLADPPLSPVSVPLTYPASPTDLPVAPASTPPAVSESTGARPPPASAPAPATQEPAARARVSERPASAARRVHRKPPAGDAAPGTADVGKPRLRLDAEPPPASTRSAAADAAETAAAAASAASAAIAQAAQAAASRVAALELALEKMRVEAKADRDALLQLRSRAADAETAGRWTPYLLGLLLLLGLVTAWLALRVRAMTRERQAEWLAAAREQRETAAAPASTDSSQAGIPSELPRTPVAPFSPTSPGPLGMSGTAGAEGGAEEPWAMRTQVLSPSPPASAESRAVSIEELIDLEQQAEFFIVLGQEDAAVDLLVEHLRSTGGGSPLPYLKLLEIYRRRNEREAYERTRARFNHRFNAVAPDWDDDVLHGRSLEDYPNIVARLQMSWPTPLDAMAELESLLFRKTKGELFDMPAYRDLLFLYSLARDLLDREPVEGGNVDVLLPLSEGATYTEPMPLEDSPEGLPPGLPDFEGHPTVPVDLDLTQPAMPDSIFGDPTEPFKRR